MPEQVIAQKPQKKAPKPPPPKTIQHPIYLKIMELEKEINRLEAVTTEEDAADYICDDLMGLNSNAYRRRIKGFHLAFNIKDKIQESSEYKYKPKGTAEEIRIKALNLKTQRLYKK